MFYKIKYKLKKKVLHWPILSYEKVNGLTCNWRIKKDRKNIYRAGNKIRNSEV